MDAFVSRKRRRVNEAVKAGGLDGHSTAVDDRELDSTEVKIATLVSLFPQLDSASLLDLLISTDGSIEKAIDILEPNRSTLSPRKRSTPSVGFQASLNSFRRGEDLLNAPGALSLPLTRKGATLHLYAPGEYLGLPILSQH